MNEPNLEQFYARTDAGFTRPLAARSRRLLAVEVDRDLAADLAQASLPNVTVITSDVLEVDLIPAMTQWLGAPPSAARASRSCWSAMRAVS